MILQVALDTPLRRVFDYLPPASMADAPPLGVRVRVPFGKQRLVGVLVDTVAHSQLPPSKLKAVIEILDDKPVIDRVTFELLKWSADYYHHPIGEVFAAALPPKLRAGEPAEEATLFWTLSAAGRESLATPKRRPKQKALLSFLAERERATVDEIFEAGFKSGVLSALKEQKLIESHSEVPEAVPEPAVDLHAAELTLTPAQAEAVIITYNINP